MNLSALKMLIDGKLTTGETERSVENPATGKVIGSYEVGNRKVARQALKAAERAFDGWSATPARDRARFLVGIANVMSEHRDELASIITMENGKPIGESEGEVDASIAHFTWYAEEGTRVYGRTVPPTDPGKRHFVVQQPVGVVACIAPWNFPLMLWARKVAPALAAGCTVVSRSASQTTLSVLKMLEYIDEVELPSGVLNHVTGPAGDISDEFLSNPICRKVTFTGSTEVGRTLLERSAANITNLSLELGGQAPAIVCRDADIDVAVNRVFGAKFRNGGRSCIAINRIFVHSDIYDVFVERFTKLVKSIVVGNGLERTVGLGPLIDQESVDKYLEHVADIPGRGGRVVYGGNRLTDGEYQNGFYVEPCVAVDVKKDMQCMCEETFGPLAPIARFEKIDDAIEQANSTPFGLSAYLYTTSLNTAFRVGERLEAGTVAVNDDVPSTTIAPFGGVKQSGLGRECGIEGIEAFLETKHLSMRL